MTAEMLLKVHLELRQLVERDADLRGVALNDVVAPILAAYYGRPDLAAIPRKKAGRRRKVQEPDGE